MEETRNKLLEAFQLHEDTPYHQLYSTFFSRSFKGHHHNPIFYSMPKVHKSPLKLRQVVSCVNSFNAIFST